jgi:hypothetical protein
MMRGAALFSVWLPGPTSSGHRYIHRVAADGPVEQCHDRAGAKRAENRPARHVPF